MSGDTKANCDAFAFVFKPMTWKTLGVFAIVGGAAVFYVHNLKEQRERGVVTLLICRLFLDLLPELLERERERTRSIGKAAIGGPFSLIDCSGERKTDQDFLGQWLMIYFGFCHCPDICPDELEKMGNVVDSVSELACYVSLLNSLFHLCGA